MRKATPLGHRSYGTKCSGLRGFRSLCLPVRVSSLSFSGGSLPAMILYDSASSDPEVVVVLMRPRDWFYVVSNLSVWPRQGTHVYPHIDRRRPLECGYLRRLTLCASRDSGLVACLGVSWGGVRWRSGEHRERLPRQQGPTCGTL